MSTWHVYLLRCADDSLYTGITTDVERRVRQHNAGKGGAYTRSHCPVKLMWSTAAHSESEARTREAEMKRWTKQRKEKFLQAQRPL